MELFIFVAVILVIVFIVVLILTIQASNDRKNQIDEAVKNATDIKIAAQFYLNDNRESLVFDNEAKLIHCFRTDKPSEKIRYQDILSAEVRTNGVMVSSKSTMETVGRAAVGGVLAGGVGAIVGGTTGDSTSIQKINKISVFVTIKNFQDPNREFVFLNGAEFESTSHVCEIYMKEAQDLMSKLSIIMDGNDIPNETKNSSALPHEHTAAHIDTISVADELKKLAELKEAGILTEEEFAAQKAKLLKN